MTKQIKPPVITHQAVLDWLKNRDGELDLYTQYTIRPDEHREAQRDADAAHYEPLIQQAIGEILGKALYGYKTKALYKDKFIPARQVIFKEDDWEAITSKYPKYVEGK